MIERTYKECLISALWNFDYKLLKIQTNGILNIPGITNLEIRDKDKIIHQNGIPSPNNSLTFTLKLIHQRLDSETFSQIGEVQVWGHLDSVYLNIWRRAGKTLLIQFLKTFFVSTAILLILNRILTQHLMTIRTHMLQSTDLTSTYKPVSLKRSKKFKDEFLSLEESINLMLKTSHEKFKQLADLNESLERQVQERFQIISDQQNQLIRL